MCKIKIWVETYPITHSKRYVHEWAIILKTSNGYRIWSRNLSGELYHLRGELYNFNLEDRAFYLAA